MSKYHFSRCDSVWSLMHLLHKLNINVIMFIAERDQGQSVDEYVRRMTKTML